MRSLSAIGALVLLACGDTVTEGGDAGAGPPERRGLQVTTGAYHTCAVRAPGRAYCWGSASEGQLGNGSTSTALPAPEAVAGVEEAELVAAGNQHSCALVSGGTVQCWGSNWSGELGDPDLEHSTTALPVPGLADVIDLAAGTHITCALQSGGQALCWGDNLYGELGGAVAAESDPHPTPIPGVGDAVQIAAGANHACAVRRSGKVACWGKNYDGQLGDGTTGTLASAVVDVAGIDDAVKVTGGLSYSCALRRGGRVSCWGSNGGYLGDGTSEGSPTPVEVVDLDDATDLAAGASDVCAVRATGEVVCWGQSGTVVSAPASGVAEPQPIAGISGARHVSVGQNVSDTHACAVRAGETLACWGRNSEGQIGDGTFQLREDPVEVAIP
ncbi:MAG: chromosome condensation regulator RCC1 [Polyangiaceae bacterium]|nr:chromosome condensation regulator RCC1 [Polyangiaceae bacterium]